MGSGPDDGVRGCTPAADADSCPVGRLAPGAGSRSHRRSHHSAVGNLAILTASTCARCTGMAPHPPFLWDASGEVYCPIDCWLANTCSFFAGFGLGMSVDDYATRVGPEVAALNEQLLTTIRGIVAEDPSAIIVAFSDHGTRYRSEASTEARRILFAARGTRVTEIEGLLVDLAAELAAER